MAKKKPQILGAKNTRGSAKPTKMNTKAPTGGKTKSGKKTSFPSMVPQLKKDGGSLQFTKVAGKKK